MRRILLGAVAVAFAAICSSAATMTIGYIVVFAPLDREIHRLSDQCQSLERTLAHDRFNTTPSQARLLFVSNPAPSLNAAQASLAAEIPPTAEPTPAPAPPAPPLEALAQVDAGAAAEPASPPPAEVKVEAAPPVVEAPPAEVVPPMESDSAAPAPQVALPDPEEPPAPPAPQENVTPPPADAPPPEPTPAAAETVPADVTPQPAEPAAEPQAPKAEEPQAPKTEEPQAPKAEEPQAPTTDEPQAPKTEEPQAPKAEDQLPDPEEPPAPAESAQADTPPVATPVPAPEAQPRLEVPPPPTPNPPVESPAKVEVPTVETPAETPAPPTPSPDVAAPPAPQRPPAPPEEATKEQKAPVEEPAAPQMVRTMQVRPVQRTVLKSFQAGCYNGTCYKAGYYPVTVTVNEQVEVLVPAQAPAPKPEPVRPSPQSIVPPVRPETNAQTSPVQAPPRVESKPAPLKSVAPQMVRVLQTRPVQRQKLQYLEAGCYNGRCSQAGWYPVTVTENVQVEVLVPAQAPAPPPQSIVPPAPPVTSAQTSPVQAPPREESRPTTPTTGRTPHGAPLSTNPDPAIAALENAINDFRYEFSPVAVSYVRYNGPLSGDCAANNAWQHRKGLGHHHVGRGAQNAALCYGSLRDTLVMWYNSNKTKNGVVGGHRAVLLDPQATEFGLDQSGPWWTLQMNPSSVQVEQRMFAGNGGGLFRGRNVAPRSENQRPGLFGRIFGGNRGNR